MLYGVKGGGSEYGRRRLGRSQISPGRKGKALRQVAGVGKRAGSQAGYRGLGAAGQTSSPSFVAYLIKNVVG